LQREGKEVGERLRKRKDWRGKVSGKWGKVRKKRVFHLGGVAKGGKSTSTPRAGIAKGAMWCGRRSSEWDIIEGAFQEGMMERWEVTRTWAKKWLSGGKFPCGPKCGNFKTKSCKS
jgi:hypothetical protein